MGKRHSKPSSKKNAKSVGIKLNTQVPSVQQNEPYEIDDPNKYDDEAVEILRKEFSEDPETFVLNQMLMSVMFFDDYQEEIRKLANTASERGKRLNAELIEDHQKQLLMPDAVAESVNRRVKFRPSRGPSKGIMQPLLAQRMFILHDTIEIEDKSDSVCYSRIDKPNYRAEIEESKESKGYVKVNLQGTVYQSEKRESSDSACSTASIKVGRKRSEIYFSKTSVEGNPSSSTSNTNDSGFSTAVNSESDYGYSRITAATTPRKLQISEKDIYTNISQLPSKCIISIKVKNKHISDSDSDSDEDDTGKPTHKHNQRQSDLFLTRYYLNSMEFMSHFKDNVFPNYLGEVLGFTEDSIQQATSIPGAIYCDTLDDKGNNKQYEVIPAIGMPWPDTIAFEWTLRRRVTVWDRREKKPIAYKWPTDKMIDEAKKLSCVVIPRGFMPKQGENAKMQIEWEVGFPKAERYLEFRMLHAQTRLFLYLVTLHKVFVEPVTHKHGLLVEHIRILMLWECESNYKAWPEDKLGTKLKMVLKTLYDHLGKGELPHYFIRSKNVLGNVPGKYLRPTQETIHHILESPVPYLLSALKHLKYMPGKFYPELDFEELHRILTLDNVLNRELQLTVIAHEQAKIQEEAKRRKERNRSRKGDKEQQWNRRYLEAQRQANARKIMNNSLEKPRNLTLEQRESVHNVDLNICLQKNFVNDTARQIMLLTFFIQHFIQIAKKSLRMSSTNQTLFYLKQAWYLTKLLETIDCENALNFQSQVKEEEENCQKKKVAEPRIPSTPKRNSNQFSEIWQIKGKEINMANLSKSYNANAIAGESKPSSSGVKRKTKLKQNQSEMKAAAAEKLVQVEVHDEHLQGSSADQEVQIRQYTQAKDIRKAVSFRASSSHVDIRTNNEDAETTSL